MEEPLTPYYEHHNTRPERLLYFAIGAIVLGLAGGIVGKCTMESALSNQDKPAISRSELPDILNQHYQPIR